MDEQQLASTFSQYKSYLQVEKGLEITTQQVYLSIIEYFFDFCHKYSDRLFLPKDWDLSQLGMRELEFFLHEHLETKGWKVNTLVTYITALRSFFGFLHHTGQIEKNPIHYAKLKRQLDEVFLAQISEAQIQQLFAEPPPQTMEGLRNRALLEMFYGIGLTPTKLSKVMQMEFDTTRSLIRFHYLRPGRWLPIAQEAQQILMAYQSARQQLLRNLKLGSAFFWLDRYGESLSASQISQILRKEFKRIGLGHYPLRVLKEVATKHFADRGADIRSLRTYRDLKGVRRLKAFKEENFEDLVAQFKKAHLRESRE